MNKLKLSLLLTLIMLTVTACSTAEKTIFTPEVAENNLSIVYIYRPSMMSNAIYSPDIIINGETRFAIKNANKQRVTLNPGEHTIEIEPDKNYAGITRLRLALESGKTTYLRVETKLEINSAIKYEPYKRTFNLVKIDAAIAIEEIGECCNTHNNNQDAAEKKLVKQKNEDAFSVEKTQNPFSH